MSHAKSMGREREGKREGKRGGKVWPFQTATSMYGGRGDGGGGGEEANNNVNGKWV